MDCKASVVLHHIKVISVKLTYDMPGSIESRLKIPHCSIHSQHMVYDSY